MTAMIQWFGMHGYAPYIWSSYGIVFGVLIANVMLMKRQRKYTYQVLQKWFKHASRS